MDLIWWRILGPSTTDVAEVTGFSGLLFQIFLGVTSPKKGEESAKKHSWRCKCLRERDVVWFA